MVTILIHCFELDSLPVALYKVFTGIYSLLVVHHSMSHFLIPCTWYSLYNSSYFFSTKEHLPGKLRQ